MGLPGVVVFVGLGATVEGREVVVLVPPIIVHQVCGTMEPWLLSGQHIPVEGVVPQRRGVIVHQKGGGRREPVKAARICVHVEQRAGAGQLARI